jgi:hypothetical protein
MNMRRSCNHVEAAAALALVSLAGLGVVGCAATQRPPVVIGVPVPTPEQPQATPPAPTPSLPTPSPASDSRPVARVGEDVTLTVWTEPRRLPAGGGQAQVIVRVLRRNGRPLPGVEVRVTSSSGTLFSRGQILTTDDRGMTRDSLTTAGPATLTVVAGGREQRLELLLGGTGIDD